MDNAKLILILTNKSVNAMMVIFYKIVHKIIKIYCKNINNL